MNASATFDSHINCRVPFSIKLKPRHKLCVCRHHSFVHLLYHKYISISMHIYSYTDTITLYNNVPNTLQIYNVVIFSCKECPASVEWSFEEKKNHTHTTTQEAKNQKPKKKTHTHWQHANVHLPRMAKRDTHICCLSYNSCNIMIHHFIFNNNNKIQTAAKKAGRFCSRDAPLYSSWIFLRIAVVHTYDNTTYGASRVAADGTAAS